MRGCHLWVIAVIVFTNAGACAAGDPAPSGGGDDDGNGNVDLCEIFDASIGPDAAPTHAGHAPDRVITQEIGNLNRFWASHVVAFAYGADLPEAMHNAVASPDGYIYYDPGFLEMYDAKQFSYAPSQSRLGESGPELDAVSVRETKAKAGVVENPGEVASHLHHVFPQEYRAWFRARGVDR